MAPGAPTETQRSVPDLSRLRIDRAAPTAARRRASPLLWLLVLALAGFLGWAYATGRLVLDDVTGGGPPVVSTAVVVAPGGPVAQPGEVTGNGYVIARKRAALSTVLSGRLVAVNVEEGTTVHEGDVVARIQHDDYDVQAKAAAQDVEVARKRRAEAQKAHAAAATDLVRLRKDIEALDEAVAQARVEVERADAEVVRNRPLREQRIVDEARWTAITAAARTAAAALLAAEAKAKAGHASEASWQAEIDRRAAAVETAEAEVVRAAEAAKQADILVEKTFVRAPFDGLVVHKDAEVGEVVAATGAGGNSRGSVATIVDPKTLEVQVELSETRLGTIAAGDVTRIVLDAAPDKAWRGKVRQVWPTADRQKATVEMRIEFVEWPPIVKPEMGARVTFLGKDAPAGPAAKTRPKVSRRAVVSRDGKLVVFVVAGGRVRRVEVVLGAEASGLVDVERGLEGGESVVLDPSKDLADGAAVATKERK